MQVNVKLAITSARQVECPDCGAIEGEPCHLPDGRTHLTRGQMRRWLSGEFDALAESIKEDLEERLAL